MQTRNYKGSYFHYSHNITELTHKLSQCNCTHFKNLRSTSVTMSIFSTHPKFCIKLLWIIYSLFQFTTIQGPWFRSKFFLCGAVNKQKLEHINMASTLNHDFNPLKCNWAKLTRKTSWLLPISSFCMGSVCYCSRLSSLYWKNVYYVWVWWSLSGVLDHSFVHYSSHIFGCTTDTVP